MGIIDRDLYCGDPKEKYSVVDFMTMLLLLRQERSQRLVNFSHLVIQRAQDIAYPSLGANDLMGLIRGNSCTLGTPEHASNIIIPSISSWIS